MPRASSSSEVPNWRVHCRVPLASYLRTNTLPQHHPVYVIKEDPKNEKLLYLGTEFAIFYSIDAGGSWTRLNKNLPTVAVHDIVIHPR